MREFHNNRRLGLRKRHIARYLTLWIFKGAILIEKMDNRESLARSVRAARDFLEKVWKESLEGMEGLKSNNSRIGLMSLISYCRWSFENFGDLMM